MAFVFSVLSLLCFQVAWDEVNESPRSLWLIATILCGLIATLSSGQGLMVWPVLLGVWLGTARKKALASPGFWLFGLCGGLAILLYSFGFQSGGQQTAALHHVKELWYYFLALLGGSSGATVALPASSLESSVAYGGCILAAVAIMFIHVLVKRPKGTLFPVAVALWSLTVAALISYGRLSLWQQQGVASRYSTFTLPLVWALLLYLAFGAERFSNT